MRVVTYHRGRDAWEVQPERERNEKGRQITCPRRDRTGCWEVTHMNCIQPDDTELYSEQVATPGHTQRFLIPLITANASTTLCTDAVMFSFFSSLLHVQSLFLIRMLF